MAASWCESGSQGASRPLCLKRAQGWPKGQVHTVHTRSVLSNRIHRMHRYLGLYMRLCAPFGAPFEGRTVPYADRGCFVYFCEQGKHRSVAWMCVEESILIAMGFRTQRVHLCSETQRWERCQRWPERKRCPHCSTSEPNTRHVLECALDECFETLLVAFGHNLDTPQTHGQ